MVLVGQLVCSVAEEAGAAEEAGVAGVLEAGEELAEGAPPQPLHAMENRTAVSSALISFFIFFNLSKI